MNESISFNFLIDTMQDALQIKILTEEIKITLKKDIDIRIYEILYEGKKGEILTIPRWVGNILRQHDFIEYHEDDMTKYISRSLNRERISKPHDLSSLDDDFYARVRQHMADIKDNEKENISVSLNSFITSRLEKIVKLAASSPLYPELEEKLAQEEKEMYKCINDISSDFKKKVINSVGN